MGKKKRLCLVRAVANVVPVYIAKGMTSKCKCAKPMDVLCIKGIVNSLKALSEIADCFSADTWAAGCFRFADYL